MFLIVLTAINILVYKSEKTAFCNQIARLSDEQRSEGEAVSGMMRTLIEILENGKLVEERRTEISLEEQVAEVHVGKCTTETSPTLVDTSVDLRSDAVAGISQRESFSMLKQVCKNNQQASDEGLQLSSGTASDIANTMSENNQNKSHDAWIRFGMATLSVVVGGILMSKSDEGNQQQEQHEQQEQRSAVRGEAESPHGSNESSLQIEEIHEEAEEEWVSVPQ